MRLSPTLHRIGNDLVALHLISTEDGVTVVDAGLPGHYRDLVSELRELGRTPADIRGVVLTHGDSDHLGIVDRLQREHDIPVYVHEADAARARGEEKTAPSWGRPHLGPTLRFLAYATAKGGLRTRYPREVATMRDGDVLSLPGAPEIIGLPGHSPGSVAVHIPAASALFVGDALTTRHVLTGVVGPQRAPFTDDQPTADASLTRLETLNVDWVIPGHGAPWSGGVAELLARYRSSHD